GRPGNVWVFLFFFSSRRRHTRFSRDWSSDVCSSDLENRGERGDIGACLGGQRAARRTMFVIATGAGVVGREHRADIAVAVEHFRSEERRVGKSVELGGRRSSKKKKNKQSSTEQTERT